MQSRLKFIFSEKATKIWEISTLKFSYVVPVKFTVEISQKFCGLLRIYELYKCQVHLKGTHLLIMIFMWRIETLY